MSKSLNKADVLRHFDEIEMTLEKAQIVGGKGARDNVDREGWAGSEWEELGFPNSTPNGTDWVPKEKPSRRLVKASLQQASTADLEQALALRKGAPNPALAEQEIMTHPQLQGLVEKSVCNQCGGNSLQKGEFCGLCNNFGFVFYADNDDVANIVKSIQAKYNVHLMDESFWKSKGKNDGGAGDRDSTTTPSGSGAPNVSVSDKDVKEDKGGKIVKAAESLASQIEKGCDPEDKDLPMLPPKKEEEEPAEDEMDMDYKKSFALLKAELSSLKKGLGFLIRNQGHLLKSQLQQSSFLADIADIAIDNRDDTYTVKGMLEEGIVIHPPAQEYQVEPVNKSFGYQPTQPARGPVSYGPGLNQIQPLQKSFVDVAPGMNIPGAGSPVGEPVSGLSLNEIKRVAAEMAITKSANGKGYLLDKNIAFAIDHGEPPTQDVLNRIEQFAQQNGIPQQ